MHIILALGRKYLLTIHVCLFSKFVNNSIQHFVKVLLLSKVDIEKCLKPLQLQG